MTETFGLCNHQKQLVHSPWVYKDVPFFFLVAGYGCIHGDTLLDTPNGKIKAKDFRGGALYSWDGEKIVESWGTTICKYDKKPMIRFELENRASIVVTAAHKFLTRSGWKTADSIQSNEALLGYESINEALYSTVAKIAQVEDSVYYDLHVPGYHNYLANGLVNHNSGKTSSLVFMVLKIVQMYHGKKPIFVGIGSPTITLFRKTLWADLERYLIMSKSKYSYNQQSNTLQIGTVSFCIIPTEQPSLIYAYNLSIFLVDELDELPQDKAMEAFTAIQERVRVDLPDGRPAFSMFVTTAQGYKGTYQVLEDLKRNGSKFIHIRGLTKANTSLSKDYVKRLYDLYTDNERLAFLEGHFVNLTTGRVYPEYNADAHDIEAFDLDPLETVYVGQDLNAGFSKAVAFIKRESKLYIVRCFSFKSISDAPYLLRKEFPTNPIEYYPDASSSELMSAYRRELLQNDIQIRSGETNPSILERVFITNKLFKTNRLFIFKIKSNYEIQMALKVRQYDELGKPEKGRGEHAVDHIMDGADYASYRIVSRDPAFRELRELANSVRTGEKKGN